MDILSLIASNNYFIYNKLIAKKLSIESAILLGFFANQYNYYEKTNQLKEINGKLYFYATRETIYTETSLSENASRKATKLLESNNILEIEKIGIPSKNYYTINNDVLLNYLENTEITSPLKNKELVLDKMEDLSFKNQSQIIINNNSNKNNNINNVEKPKKDFILNENIKCIIDYLNATANTKYKYTTKGTVSLIKARFNDGFTLDDFYDVIDNKWKEWKNTEWEKYMRPETLFGNKFENYLNGKQYFKGTVKCSFDNTASHNIPKAYSSMNKQEQQNYSNNCLARDENGNVIQF